MASRNPRKQKTIRQPTDTGKGLYDALVQATTAPVMRPPVRSINLDDIVEDREVQVRTEGLNPEKVEEYKFRLENGSEAPPIDVFALDNGKYLLAAGFHRVAAYRQAGRSTISANVRQGDVYDARELAEDDNLQHGLPYTLADKFNVFKRRYVDGRTWFEKGEDGQIQQIVSGREIAKSLGVSAMTITRWKSEVETVTGVTVDDSKVVGADGKRRDISQIRQTAAKRFEDYQPEEKKVSLEDDLGAGAVLLEADSFEMDGEFLSSGSYYDEGSPAFEAVDSPAALQPAHIEPTPNPFERDELSRQDIYGMYRTMVLKIKELDRLYEQLSTIRGLDQIQSVMGMENVVNLQHELQHGLQTTSALERLLHEYLQKV